MGHSLPVFSFQGPDFPSLPVKDEQRGLIPLQLVHLPAQAFKDAGNILKGFYLQAILFNWIRTHMNRPISI